MTTGGSFNRELLWSFSVAILLCAPIHAAAQGAVEGVARDTAGEPLPGVMVELTGAAIERPRQTVTGRDGRFQFTALPIGIYRVTLTLPGFAALSLSAFVSAERPIAPVEAVMEIAPILETITIPPIVFPQSPFGSPARPLTPKALCGMTMLPADPSIDPGIRKPVVPNGYTIRAVPPPMCGD